LPFALRVFIINASYMSLPLETLHSSGNNPSRPMPMLVSELLKKLRFVLFLRFVRFVSECIDESSQTLSSVIAQYNCSRENKGWHARLVAAMFDYLTATGAGPTIHSMRFQHTTMPELVCSYSARTSV